MIPPISHGSSSTVIALTLPETGSEGTLLIQRGDLAHMSQFAHTSETNFDALIQQAVTALAVVESEPPVIPDPPRCKTTPKVAPPSEPPEPVFQVPTRMKKGRKTTTIPTRCLDIVDGVAAQEAALKVAGRLLDSGLWDGKMRDELLNDEIFYSLKEAQVLIEDWRCHYNTQRPHSSLDYRPPAPEVILVPPPRHNRSEPDLTSGLDSGGRPEFLRRCRVR